MFSVNRLLLAAAFFLSASGSAYADASSAQYRGCDGYGAASNDGDGMTELATVLLIFSPPGYGNTARNTTSPGAAGIADCDAALADLPVKHWMRKVSLLRARAMHRLDNNDTTGALADLDLAVAAAKYADDPLYARSLGLGVTYVRAFALQKSGDVVGAKTLALNALAQRPFNRQSVVSALMSMGVNAPSSDIEKVEHILARLAPREIDQVFVRKLQNGQFQEAMALYPQLVPYREIGQVNISEGQHRERDMREFGASQLFRASRAGAYAYALINLGRVQEAQSVLTTVRAQLVKDTQPPPALDSSLSPSEHARQMAYREEDVANRIKVASGGNKLLDIWGGFVDLRLMIDQGKMTDALKVLQSKKGTWEELQLLDIVLVKLPKSDKASIATAEALKLAWTKAVKAAREPSMDTVFKSLPEPESVGRIPPYEPAKQPLFRDSGEYADMQFNGYQMQNSATPDVVTVSFRGERSTASLIEDMALLRAADLARQAGKKGLIIVDRHDTAFTVSTEYYGRVVRTDPNGFETDLDVLFVDPNALPEKYRDQAWRVIDTDEAYAALAPVYIRSKATTKPGPDAAND
jgi:hypothetical protein